MKERNTQRNTHKDTHTKKHTQRNTHKETHTKQSPRTPDRLLLYFVTMDITNVWSVWYSGTGQGIPARCMRIKFRYSLLLHIFKALVVLMCLNFAFAYLESPSTVFIFCFVHKTRREREERRERREPRKTSREHQDMRRFQVHHAY